MALGLQREESEQLSRINQQLGTRRTFSVFSSVAPAVRGSLAPPQLSSPTLTLVVILGSHVLLQFLLRLVEVVLHPVQEAVVRLL